MGIDIGDLETCILVGVPRSTTSLQQRIGRVVAGAGVAIHSERRRSQQRSRVQEPGFTVPKDLWLRAPCTSEQTYPVYPRHVPSQVAGNTSRPLEELTLAANPTRQVEASGLWPSGFAGLCRAERTGQVPQDLQSDEDGSRRDAHYVYPLRDVGVQFTVELRQGPIQHALGSLTHSQVMREAYPGAIYYYATRPYRVYKVLPRSKKVLVRGARYYTTSPNQGPTMVYPNLADEG